MKFRELFNDDLTVNWDKINKLHWFAQLKTTPQSEAWHKEKNCLEHTMLVTDAMREILDKNENTIPKGGEDWLMCMSAAICHDLGKGETTKWSEEKKDWTTKNHGVVGERITRNLFCDEDIVLREKVCYMVRHHMTLHHIFGKLEETDKRLEKLSHGIVPIIHMIHLVEADSRGSINDIETTESIKKKICDIATRAFSLHCLTQPYSFVEKSQLIRSFIDFSGEVVNKSNDFCVYIMCGFPGCGKTTYIQNNLSDKTVISRDVIRCELGINGATLENDKKTVGTKEEEEKVSEIFNARMIECCENRESFVLDNTNLKYQYRKEYLLKVMKYNPKVQIIYVEAPDFIETCRERRGEEMPKSVYKRMNDNFDFPQLFECDELIIIKQDEDGNSNKYTFKGDYSPNFDKGVSGFLTDLKITRGAMILDGYDCYDSCIKYMDELIDKYDGLVRDKWLGD